MIEVTPIDVLDNIYQALIANPTIVNKVGNRIKYYDYPETADFTKSYIIIDPLDAPLPSVSGDNVWLVEEQIIQIDVWTKSRAEKLVLGSLIREIMQSISYAQSGSGVDEYDKDLKIYRDGRRYLASHHKKGEL
ncbi:hypothetical protein [Jeotgalibaca porci]|uniref:hypothetical protein n=1 Tax=Jeotgalibaca porci TaxID=1868793 RepID=UPI0035A031AD